MAEFSLFTLVYVLVGAILGFAVDKYVPSGKKKGLIPGFIALGVLIVSNVLAFVLMLLPMSEDVATLVGNLAFCGYAFALIVFYKVRQ